MPVLDLSPLFLLSCLFLLAYIRSSSHSTSNSPYPHTYGSLLILSVIVPVLLGLVPARSSSLWTWAAYFFLWLVPPILIMYCLLLSPLHIFWSPADLLMKPKGPVKSTPPARVFYDPRFDGLDPQDIVVE